MNYKLFLMTCLLIKSSLVLAFPNPETAMDKLIAKDLEFTEKEFFHAVSFNRHDDIKWFVKAGMNPNKIKNEYGQFAIHIANGTRVDTMRLLLDLGADPNIKDKYGNNALHRIAFTNSEKLLRMVLEKGVDINAKNSRGKTALHKIANQGHVKILEVMLQAGAFANEEDNDGKTPLMVAIESGRHEMISMLVKYGADINYMPAAERAKNFTPLISAIRQNDIHAVKALINSGVDTNKASPSGFTPIMIALMEANTELISLLLHNKAQISYKGGRKMNALHLCVKNGWYDLCDRLIKTNKERLISKKESESLIYDAISQQDSQKLRSLLKLGLIAEFGDVLHSSPLVRAVMNEDYESVDVLIKAGVDLNKRDPSTGQSIAFILGRSQMTSRKMLDILLKSNLKLNAVDKMGRTPLMIAAAHGNLDTVQALINADSDISIKSQSGQTALNWGVRAGRILNVEALLAHDARKCLSSLGKLTTENYNKITPITSAIQLKNKHIELLLKKRTGC